MQSHENAIGDLDYPETYSLKMGNRKGYISQPSIPQEGLVSGRVSKENGCGELVDSLDMDGWKTTFLLGWPFFGGAMFVLGSVI